MLLKIPLSEQQPAVYTWENQNNETELLQVLAWQGRQLADFNQNYTHAKARLTHLNSRCLLAALNLQIEKDERGKPFLRDNHRFISISHNLFYSVVALHTQPVGVDVETISRRFEPIKAKFVDKQALIWAQNLNKNQQTSFFSYYWAGKEAAYKLQGAKIADFANMIAIEPFTPEKNTQTFVNMEKNATFAPCKLLFLPLGCNQLLALAY